MAGDAYVIESEFATNLHKILKRGDPRPGEWTTYGELSSILGDVDRSVAIGTHLMNCDSPVCGQYARRVLEVGGSSNPKFKRTDRSDTRTQREVLEEEGLRFIANKADPEAHVPIERF